MTDTPDYRGFRIKEIHAIVGVGDDDEEGVCAFIGRFGPTPLIAADPKRLDEIKKIAQEIADESGQSFEIVKFSVREKIGDIRSRRLSSK